MGLSGRKEQKSRLEERRKRRDEGKSDAWGWKPGRQPPPSQDMRSSGESRTHKEREKALRQNISEEKQS